jgi:hypothetical protein
MTYETPQGAGNVCVSSYYQIFQEIYFATLDTSKSKKNNCWELHLPTPMGLTQSVNTNVSVTAVALPPFLLKLE